MKLPCHAPRSRQDLHLLVTPPARNATPPLPLLALPSSTSHPTATWCQVILLFPHAFWHRDGQDMFGWVSDGQKERG